MTYVWRNVNGVATLRTVPGECWVACSECDWSGWRPTMPAGRAAAHRHVVKTGHEVKAVATRAHVYGPQP